MHVYFINCFVAKPYRETLPVAPNVRFAASVEMMWPICYSDTFFNFLPGDCVSSGRLREVKNN